MHLGIPCFHGLLLFLCCGGQRSRQRRRSRRHSDCLSCRPGGCASLRGRMASKGVRLGAGRFWTMVVPWMEAQSVAAGGAVGETAVPMKAGPIGNRRRLGRLPRAVGFARAARVWCPRRIYYFHALCRCLSSSNESTRQRRELDAMQPKRAYPTFFAASCQHGSAVKPTSVF